ncbi:MAG: hypothetical protein JXA41_08295 [Deltaproteobacteria bacterium]|nr:hypothetical protein [Deltaproteobacteria bacterium]
MAFKKLRADIFFSFFLGQDAFNLRYETGFPGSVFSQADLEAVSASAEFRFAAPEKFRIP